MSTLLAMSGAVSSDPRGDAIFRPEDGGNTQTWIVPDGVTSICALLISAGGNYIIRSTSPVVSAGGNGGNLRYMNNIIIPPEGRNLRIRFFDPQSHLNSPGITYLEQQIGTTWTTIFRTDSAINSQNGIFGGNGGNGGVFSDVQTYGLGGGGAGGYSGNGGVGYYPTQPTNGSGGGGGGGYSQGNGGSTYIYGEGSSGAAGINGDIHGKDGSVISGKTGRVWAGGGSGTYGTYTGTLGIVRILWGEGRAFPSTNVSTSTN